MTGEPVERPAVGTCLRSPRSLSKWISTAMKVETISVKIPASASYRKANYKGTPEHGKLCGPGGRDFLNSRPTTMGKGKTMATKKQRAAARK